MIFPLGYIPKQDMRNGGRHPFMPSGLANCTLSEVTEFAPDSDPIRQIERASISLFIQEHAGAFASMNVLDYGCGTAETCVKPQPYRGIVEKAGGKYTGYDKAEHGDFDDFEHGEFDAVICTQVIQCADDPLALLTEMGDLLREDGVLLLTYPTAWPDLPGENYRFTKTGMTKTVTAAGFKIGKHISRAMLYLDNGFALSLGGAVMAVRK